jgi:hypothetical protein
MRKFVIFITVLHCTIIANAQELYVSTEPASNMPSKSIGIRLNNEIMPSYTNKAQGVNNAQVMYRLNPEIMIGISKKWMAHINLYASNMHQNSYKFEGAEVYTKFRFLSFDQVHSHFRVAAYGKASLINNPIQYNDINLTGDNSGLGGGIVATQLIHKLAISFTGGYARSMNNTENSLSKFQPKDALNYSLSFGLLTFPIKYTSYNQPNVNLYVEFLGKANPVTNEQYIDIAPAIQVILKSRLRIDLGYKKQLTGNMLRINTQEFFVRLEYNIFNAY